MYYCLSETRTGTSSFGGKIPIPALDPLTEGMIGLESTNSKFNRDNKNTSKIFTSFRANRLPGHKVTPAPKGRKTEALKEIITNQQSTLIIFYMKIIPFTFEVLLHF